MPELTADVVLRKIKSGEKVERADLRGLAMPKAVLEGVSFRRCDLDAMEAGPRRTKQHWRLQSPVSGGVRSLVDAAKVAASASRAVERHAFTEIL